MIQNAVLATVRFGTATTAEVAQLVLDNTLGRFLDTNPDKVR